MIKCEKSTCPNDKFNGCCVECPEYQTCVEKCNEHPQDCKTAIFEDEEIRLQTFNNIAKAVIKKITSLCEEKAKIEAAEKKMREQLQKFMETYEVKKFENESLRITYTDAHTRSSIDSDKLKNNYPDIANKCMKSSSVKASITIKLKD